MNYALVLTAFPRKIEYSSDTPTYVDAFEDPEEGSDELGRVECCSFILSLECLVTLGAPQGRDGGKPNKKRHVGQREQNIQKVGQKPSMP